MIRYLQSGDDSATQLVSGGQIADDGDGFWAGAQRCFASIAIAAAIAVTALATDIAQGMQQDSEEIPAGSLKKFTSPDEDYWSPCANATGDGQVAPIPPTLYQRLPYLPDPTDDPAGSLAKFGTPDEDFWASPVAPIPPTLSQRLPYLPDLTDDPAGALHGLPEETEWRSGVAPAAPQFWQSLPLLSDAAEIPPQPSFLPDEDFWLNPVVPVPAALRFPLPYLPDPSDEPAQFHWIELDWYAPSNATSSVGYNIYRGTSGPGSEGSTPINPSPVDVGASPNSLCTYNDCNIQWGQTYWYVVYAYDTSTGLQSSSPTNEISASFPPVIDEDFWQNPAAPIPGSTYQPLPLGDFSDDPAGSLKKFSSPDEDYWQQLQMAQISQIVPLPFPDSGEQPTAFTPDEDYWQRPQRAQIPQILPSLPDPEEVPAGSLLKFTTPDEDYWQNPVAPVPATIFQELPYDPDPEEIPPWPLHGQPDEDFWVKGVTPAPATIYQPLPYASGESAEVVPFVTAPPDEDFWRNPVPPVPAAIYQPLPYLPDLSDDPAGSLRGVPEETEWQNWVAPVAARICQLLPYASGETAEILPSVVSDEDCWPPLAIAAGGLQNPVIPAQAAQCWGQPVICGFALYQTVQGFDDFSSYWWLSTWGVCTHSAARGRVSHSAARERISRSAVRPRTSRGVSRQSTW